MSHIAIIEQFYGAFANKDLPKMIDCYHPDVEFQDPVFGLLDYEHTCAMWDMLIKAGADLEIYFDNVQSEGDKGSVEWGAIYTFSKTGRKVHNRIKANLQFADGKIIKHTDQFDLWRWTQMAFGPIGFVMGWTPFFKSKLRAQVRRSLLSFMKKNQA
ncbi:nuclear transport factor 2 family protein [Reichenbachiella ulvae]|uniref:Nuclear transport factor 2 family protein n=1 Tax=Reichenbachiella ulvae TaxID=2980104 RepID=A0ABT3CUJ2_9BACT|nr:nuclear transport factor 2 family protein [Reichenbachiella ulvae]MCV9386908.1 nuclear transport factor 2 family protein [Reichenbachiella ulvae]